MLSPQENVRGVHGCPAIRDVERPGPARIHDGVVTEAMVEQGFGSDHRGDISAHEHSNGPTVARDANHNAVRVTIRGPPHLPRSPRTPPTESSRARVGLHGRDLVFLRIARGRPGSLPDGARPGGHHDHRAVAVHPRVSKEVEVDVLFRQGVARFGGGWIFSFNDGLFRTDDAFRITSRLQPAIPDVWKARRFDHIGDIDVVDGVLYAPLEQPNYARGRQAMLTYDAATLAYRDGHIVEQHENSFVTVDPDTHIAYAMNNFGGSTLLRYDRAWKRLLPLRMSRHVERVQGADVFGGAVWLATDDTTDAVYRVDLATGKTIALGSIGHVDGEGEGIDATPLRRGDLHVLSIDARVVPVRLIDLRVTARPSSP